MLFLGGILRGTLSVVGGILGLGSGQCLAQRNTVFSPWTPLIPGLRQSLMKDVNAENSLEFPSWRSGNESH